MNITTCSYILHQYTHLCKFSTVFPTPECPKTLEVWASLSSYNHSHLGMHTLSTYRVTHLENVNQLWCHHHAHDCVSTKAKIPPSNPHPLNMILCMHHGWMGPCPSNFPKMWFLMWVALKSCLPTCVCCPSHTWSLNETDIETQSTCSS